MYFLKKRSKEHSKNHNPLVIKAGIFKGSDNLILI